MVDSIRNLESLDKVAVHNIVCVILLQRFLVSQQQRVLP